MSEVHTVQGTAEQEAISHLKTSLQEGVDWPTAMLQAMARWTRPEELIEGRRYNYFIGGEAFDWLALLERLSHEVEEQIPRDELEELLFTGRFPASFDESSIQDLLGVDKYRGYLNYFYGVEVESALQQSVETEVEKRYYANGLRYTVDHSDEIFFRIYRATLAELRESFWADIAVPEQKAINLTELKEFTYWLFKLRLKVSDKAKIASDTRKGLNALDKGDSLQRNLPSSPVAVGGFRLPTTR
jgi:hypothetical protein